MSDYWTRWKAQANAINAIFVEYGKKIYDVDGSWAHTGEDKEMTFVKKKILDERNVALEMQRAKYRLE